MINHLEGRVSVTAEELEALRAARWAKHVPMKVLGRILRVSPRTIQSWQRAERRPTSDQLRAWWRALA